MEHLIDEKDYSETLDYYIGKYEYLTTKRNLTPAAACVVIFAATVDVALRVVFSNESEMIQELEERVSALEGDSEQDEAERTG